MVCQTLLILNMGQLNLKLKKLNQIVRKSKTYCYELVTIYQYKPAQFHYKVVFSSGNEINHISLTILRNAFTHTPYDKHIVAQNSIGKCATIMAEIVEVSGSHGYTIIKILFADPKCSNLLFQ
jgi:hypothetical protein